MATPEEIRRYYANGGVQGPVTGPSLMPMPAGNPAQLPMLPQMQLPQVPPVDPGVWGMLQQMLQAAGPKPPQGGGYVADPEKTRWQNGLGEMLSAVGPAVAGATENNPMMRMAGATTAPVVSWLNEKEADKKPKAKAAPAAPAPTFNFGQPTAKAKPAAAAASNVPAPPPPPEDLDMLVRTIWGEARSQTPEQQALAAQVILNRSAAHGGSIKDTVLAKGQFEPWGDGKGSQRDRMLKLDPNSEEYQKILANIQPAVTGAMPNAGYDHFYAAGNAGRAKPAWDNGTGTQVGDHIFFKLGYGGAPAGSPVGKATSNWKPGDGAPSIGFLTPEAAAGYVKDPRLLSTNVDLPSAPKEPMPEALPQKKLLDPKVLLAEYRDALKVDKRDKTNDAWDRMQAMLTNAAAAASQMGSNASFGQLIGAAGAAGAAGFTQERKGQEAKDAAEQQQERVARLALAKMGFDIALTNEDIAFANDQSNWQSGENKRKTGFSNDIEAWKEVMKEYEINLGRQDQNATTLNRVDERRGEVALNAAKGAVDAENTATGAAIEMAQKGESQGYKTLLKAEGISEEPIKDEDPTFANARQTARYIDANNVEGATASLANEMLVAGDVPDWMFSPKELKEIGALAKKAQRDANALAELHDKVHAALKKPGNAVKAAQELASRGRPSARMIVQRNRPAA